MVGAAVAEQPVWGRLKQGGLGNGSPQLKAAISVCYQMFAFSVSPWRGWQTKLQKSYFQRELDEAESLPILSRTRDLPSLEKTMFLFERLRLNLAGAARPPIFSCGGFCPRQPVRFPPLVPHISKNHDTDGGND